MDWSPMLGVLSEEDFKDLRTARLDLEFSTKKLSAIQIMTAFTLDGTFSEFADIT
jgi:hypothetical protein